MVFLCLNKTVMSVWSRAGLENYQGNCRVIPVTALLNIAASLTSGGKYFVKIMLTIPPFSFSSSPSSSVSSVIRTCSPHLFSFLPPSSPDKIPKPAKLSDQSQVFVCPVSDWLASDVSSVLSRQSHWRTGRSALLDIIHR